MKLTKEMLFKIIAEEKQKILKEKMSKKDDQVLSETVMVALQPMIKPIHQEMTQDDFWMKVAGIKAEPMNEGEVVDFPGMDREPSLPWVFGPEGYIKRSELSQQYEKKEDVGADSPPEVMIARAMAYRASELTNYQQEFDDEIFSDYAMRIYQDYVIGKSGDRFQALDSMLNRIDDGGWDDEEIMEIASTAEMSQTKEMAARQDQSEIDKDDIDFSAFLDSLGKNVVEFPETD